MKEKRKTKNEKRKKKKEKQTCGGKTDEKRQQNEQG
jgi:hypothetical protein